MCSHCSLVCTIFYLFLKVASLLVFSMYFLYVECIVEENMYMIVSPKDVVVALQRDQDDHITWLVEHHKFEVRAEEIIVIPMQCIYI